MATLGPGVEHRAHHATEAKKARWRMAGNAFGPVNFTPAGDIGADLGMLTRNPEAFLKNLPAVKQVRAEFGKTPRGYEDAAHYLANAPTPEAERKSERMREQAGKREFKKEDRKALR